MADDESGFGEESGSGGFGRGRGGGFGKRGGFGRSNTEDSSESGGGAFGRKRGGGFGDSGRTNGWEGEGNDGDGGDRSSGFKGRGRRENHGGYKESNEDDDIGGGGSRGGFGRGGGRGGFRKRAGDEDGNEDVGSGFGGRGRRGGFGGRRDQDGGDEDEGSGGRRRGGGFGGRRDQDGGNENEEGSGGRGRRGGGGFGGRRDRNAGEEDTEGSGGRGRRGGGFGGRRDRDGKDNGEGSGGYGRGRGGDFSQREEGGEGSNDNPEGGRKTELYVPPAPPEDEESLFATMAAGINFDKYDEISVEVTGRDPPQHISTFDDCGFSEYTVRNIERCKYTRPTPVQKYAIPIIMAGRDLMACAQTGSGKTAAFLLPVISRLLREEVPGGSQGEQQSPQVLIISPTRELTLQIYGEARKFVHESMYRPVVVYGGTSVGYQLRQLESGCNILVSTPGRLVDFLNRKKVLLDQLKVLILDEADRMLDMGFEPEIRRVVEQYQMPSKEERQTLMFSATFPAEIQHLAADFLHDHVFLTVGVVGGTTSDIKQCVVEVDEYQKREKLQEILSESGSDRVLVFVETKRNADFLASYLSQENFPTTSIHGDRFQREREEALRDFRSGRSRVLVATSVAARGLDIPKVKHVVNFDLPNNIDEYVHRIGRTGRIGNKGIATAFFQKDRDAHLARSLVKVLADAQQDIDTFLEQAAEEAVGSSYGPAGGKFASKDVRYQGRRGNRDDQGDSSGFGDGGGVGGNFGESQEGGFQAPAAAADDDDEW